eukprot:1957287-Rhodomonas_salina.1
MSQLAMHVTQKGSIIPRQILHHHVRCCLDLLLPPPRMSAFPANFASRVSIFHPFQNFSPWTSESSENLGNTAINASSVKKSVRIASNLQLCASLKGLGFTGLNLELNGLKDLGIRVNLTDRVGGDAGDGDRALLGLGITDLAGGDAGDGDRALDDWRHDVLERLERESCLLYTSDAADDM